MTDWPALGRCLSRIRRLPRQSIKPAIAAKQPNITPTTSNEAEQSAHIIWAVHHRRCPLLGRPGDRKRHQHRMDRMPCDLRG
jgi:hypothetical protein